jgi:hypothetical protein
LATDVKVKSKKRRIGFFYKKKEKDLNETFYHKNQSCMQLGSGVKKAKIYEQINLQWVAPHKS